MCLRGLISVTLLENHDNYITYIFSIISFCVHNFPPLSKNIVSKGRSINSGHITTLVNMNKGSMVSRNAEDLPSDTQIICSKMYPVYKP